MGEKDMSLVQQKEVRTQAKKKLKRHIERCANDPTFKVTKQKSVYWFNVINKAAFGEKLPKPKITVRTLKNIWGECSTLTDGNIEITINDQIPSRTLFIATIAHEMVHHWQHVFEEGRMSHINTFLSWKRRFRDKFDIRL